MLILREVLSADVAESRKGVKFWLWDGAEIAIGRCSNPGQAHIVMAAATVGRKHATIRVIRDGTNLIAMLTDENSKFGTRVNGEKISGTIRLNLGDTIQFASFDKKWRLIDEPLNVVASSLRPQEKIKLKEILSNLGGQLVNELTSNCNYLCMNGITITAKALKALVDGIPIVIPEFFHNLQSAIVCVGLVKQIPPKKSDFLPKIVEPSLAHCNVPFAFNPTRKILFSGMKFYFLSKKQLDKLNEVVNLAGGQTIFISETDLGNLDVNIIGDLNALLLQPPPSEMNQSHYSRKYCEFRERILAKYKSSKKRLITESEVSLAVVYGSTQKFCNPLEIESFAQHSRAPTAPSDSLDSPEESPIAEYKKPKFWVPETQLPEDLNAVSDSLDTAEISDSQIAMDELTEIPESPEVPNSPDIQFMSDQPTMSQPVVGDNSDLYRKRKSDSQGSIESYKRQKLGDQYESETDDLAVSNKAVNDVLYPSNANIACDSATTEPSATAVEMTEKRNIDVAVNSGVKINGNSKWMEADLNGVVKAEETNRPTTSKTNDEQLPSLEPSWSYSESIVRKLPVKKPQVSRSEGSNFKRFKKAAGQLSLGTSKIIGGNDLLPHTKFKKIGEELDDFLLPNQNRTG